MLKLLKKWERGLTGLMAVWSSVSPKQGYRIIFLPLSERPGEWGGGRLTSERGEMLHRAGATFILYLASQNSLAEGIHNMPSLPD